MKAFSNYIIFASFFGASLCGAQQVASGQSSVTPPTPYSVVASGANSRVWERTLNVQGPNGQSTSEIERFTELATGLNYQDPTTGQWVPSQEEIEVLPNGTAAATQGQHKVYFPGNIYQGEIELVTPDGIQLQSRPMGISYDDGAKNVFIAILTNSIGQLVSSNQIIYPNAFEGLDADLLYTYTKSGLEQNIIIRSMPPSPAASGLNLATTRLQVLTEFFDPPKTAVSTTPIPSQGGIALNDESLDFGVMRMMQGRAFLFGTDASDAGVWVAKSWVQIDGRQFLVEEIPLAALANQLAALPAPQITQKAGALPMIASHTLQLPPQHLAKASPFALPMQLSQNAFPSKGLVFDYQTLSANTTNYDFQGDTTYYISGNVILSGTNNIFEGGTVIKYARGYGITLSSSAAVNWVTGAYRPVIFTAVDDNAVGQAITGSSGSPSGYYANAALDFAGTNIPTISHARFAYVQTGVITAAGNSVPYFYDDQFVQCQYAAQFNGSTIYLRNTLFANVQTNFVNVGATNLNLQNVTFNNITVLATVLSGTPNLFLTNCIFANVTNYGPVLTNGGYNGFYNSTSFGANSQTSISNPFQTVGGGGYYLTNGGNFLNAGTANIDPVLLASLGNRTVFPPTVYSLVAPSSDLNLSPVVARDDSGNPDLGYHYDPLDYAFGVVYCTNNIFINPGTAIALFTPTNPAVYGYGIGLNDAAQMVCQGEANQLIHLAVYNEVQESAGSWYEPTYALVTDSFGGSPGPIINSRFADWSVPAQDASLANLDNSGIDAFSDSQFHGGQFDVEYQSVNITNCLFERVDVEYTPNDGNTPSIINNSFWNGTFNFQSTVTNTPVKNNLFDQTIIPPPVSHRVGATHVIYLASNAGHNAYVTNGNTLDPVFPSDVILSNSPVYQSSWFGNYYLPPASPLINAGSTTADQVGLYHFTTQTNQIPETNSIVDIGYHYVATDQYGNPLDSNGDGIPDYLEDPAGNGSGNWNATMFLNVLITQPQNGSTIP